MIHFTLSTKQLALLDDLTHLYATYENKCNQFSNEKIDFIKMQSMISNIGASTRIENALLTDIEVEWIHTTLLNEQNKNFESNSVLYKVSQDKQRSLEEVLGYREASQLIFYDFDRLKPLMESSIKGLHKLILKYDHKASYHCGEYKIQSNSVYETNLKLKIKKIILKTADPGIVTQTSMSLLIEWYHQTIQEYPSPIPIACEFIFRFLAIHPFQDGNGRLSRLLFQLLLLHSGKSYFHVMLPLIALDRTIEQTRSKYYYVLKKCSGGVFNPEAAHYNYLPFFDYMLERLKEAIVNVDYYALKFDRFKTLSSKAKLVLSCFKTQPELFLSTKVIVEKTNIPRRTVIFLLNKLLDLEFIESLGQGASRQYKLRF